MRPKVYPRPRGRRNRGGVGVRPSPRFLGGDAAPDAAPLPTRTAQDAMRSPSALPTLLPALAALLLLASAASAQQAELRGRVTDRNTGAPVVRAVVEVERAGRAAVTDEQGAFTLPRLPAGVVSVSVSALGYAEATDTLTLLPGAAPENTVTLGLTPDPVLLEGLKVSADRFRERRDALAVPVQVLGSGELATSSTRDVQQFLRYRLGLRSVGCSGALGRLREVGEESCVLSRGRPAPVRVYVDDGYVPGGLSMLSTLRPGEVEMVEVFDAGRQVRVYTSKFMEWAARSRYVPPPFRI